MIKAVIFDLDNTLMDFMKMKSMSIDAAIYGMIEAGMNIDFSSSKKLIFSKTDKNKWNIAIKNMDIYSGKVNVFVHDILGIAQAQKINADYYFQVLKIKGMKTSQIWFKNKYHTDEGFRKRYLEYQKNYKLKQ